MEKIIFIALSIILSGLNIAQAEECKEELEHSLTSMQPLQKEEISLQKPMTAKLLSSNNDTSPLHTEAFNYSLQSALPLTPEQILKLRKQFNQTQAAMAAYPDIPPKPIQMHHSLDLSTRSTPMVIRLAQGYVTALVFLDSTSQPWPIKSYNIGDPQAFNVQWDKKSHVLIIQANMLYGKGNISVMLNTLDEPIMLTLLSGQQTVDYRVNIRIPRAGPNAKQLVGRSLPEQVSTDLLGILDGVPPENSKPLRVIGGDEETQAWVSGKRFYLRTRLTILSPSWLSMVSSADGTHAYELPRLSFVLGSYHGERMKLKIEEI